MPTAKKILLLSIIGTLAFASVCVAMPGAGSYIYIQGDKQTPFYVKVNGNMQPRYGKNYCIIPKLQAGPLEIEILYQQNAYAPQTYTFTVPENSQRGFLLARKDTAYALYDIDAKNYLYPTKK